MQTAVSMRWRARTALVGSLLLGMVASWLLAAAPVGAATSVTLGTATSATLGSYLTGPSGHTHYWLSSDTATGATCTGGCLTNWPPLSVSAGATVTAAGVGGTFTTFTRPDTQALQVAYDGHPLYYFAHDSAAGQTNGAGIAAFGGTWHVAAVAAGGMTLYVSPTGSSSGADTSCSTAAYTKINDAVSAASAGDTVIVCAGTYKEDVAISRALTLSGQSADTTIIDATGLDNGIKIAASNVIVSGFTVENATGEGILAQQPNPVKGPMIQGIQLYTGAPITNVVIGHNTVENNDQGGLPANVATTKYAECQASGNVPGDCGEGIHLWSVANSQVLFNTVTGNSGGILLTDEFGPTYGNLIAGNIVTDNASDCGITLPGHNLALNPQTHKLMPSFGGVYDNIVRSNVVLDNGLLGQGAGILVAAPAPGTASYNNVIEDNAIAGNGLAGVTMHGHAAGAFIGGNQVLDNIIGPNNMDGDTDVSPTADNAKTGILVWSAATPITVTISGNTIFGDWYGIWMNTTVSALGAAHLNTFQAVSTHVHHA